MIVFAAHHAVVTCPGGPRIRTWIGRRDSDIPARDGKLPNPHGSGDSLLRLFLAKGLSARELAALIGAHTCSRSFFQPPPGFGDQGFPQDTSPGVWDVRYYQQTINPPRDRIFRFESDVNLANHPTVGREFRVSASIPKRRTIRLNIDRVISATKGNGTSSSRPLWRRCLYLV